MTNLIKRAGHSLLGHVIVFETVFSLPMLIYGFAWNHARGSLTLSSAALMLLEVSALVVAGASAVWYLITLPLIKRKKQQ